MYNIRFNYSWFSRKSRRLIQENVELAQAHLEKNEIINAMAKLIYSEVDCIEMGNMAKEIKNNKKH